MKFSRVILIAVLVGLGACSPNRPDLSRLDVQETVFSYPNRPPKQYELDHLEYLRENASDQEIQAYLDRIKKRK